MSPLPRNEGYVGDGRGNVHLIDILAQFSCFSQSFSEIFSRIIEWFCDTMEQRTVLFIISCYLHRVTQYASSKF